MFRSCSGDHGGQHFIFLIAMSELLPLIADISAYDTYAERGRKDVLLNSLRSDTIRRGNIEFSGFLGGKSLLYGNSIWSNGQHGSGS